MVAKPGGPQVHDETLVDSSGSFRRLGVPYFGVNKDPNFFAILGSPIFGNSHMALVSAFRSDTIDFQKSFAARRSREK